MGSGLPGHNGPAPRASRSSRGRAGVPRKVAVSIEWLATVAGELLGDSVCDGLVMGANHLGVNAGGKPRNGSNVEEWVNVVRSDNESGTSQADADKLVDLHCLMNQANNDEALRAAAAAAAGQPPPPPVNLPTPETTTPEETLTEIVRHVQEACTKLDNAEAEAEAVNKVVFPKVEEKAAAAPTPVVVEEKPVVVEESVARNRSRRTITTKVKDEQSTSECIMGEPDEKPGRTRRGTRKRKLPKSPSWMQSCSKRKHADPEGEIDKPDYYQSTGFNKRKQSIGGEEMIWPPFCGDSEPPAAAAKLRRAKAASVAASTGKGARKAADGHVRVSVKSFTIPELYVDIPESATVGTLKRAVMDAAMNLLGGGLRVCVLLQGRKIPDEGATLSQMGISQKGKTDSLGFMLEPTTVPSSSLDDPLLVLLHAAADQPTTTRCPTYVSGGWAPGPNCVPMDAEVVPPPPVPCRPETMTMPWDPSRVVTTVNGMVNGMVSGVVQGENDEHMKNDSDSTSTLSQATPSKQRVFDSKALIVHPSTLTGLDTSNHMALLPLRPKNALDIHKRRIRRPFSVGEVEGLVQAVEQLGTGRWRDVKVQAFENAKHRTYVDLKDKWKTLVHTAQIAPHQRRGDPVPQELLDRVIRANDFWTAHQAKEQEM